MKICFMTACLFSNGGVSRVLTALASELAIRGHKVTVITTEDPSIENRDKYKLDEKVSVEFMASVWADEFGRRCFRKMVHMAPHLTSVPKLWDWAFASEYECDLWLKYIRKDDYDVVIAVHGRLSYTLGKISDKLDCVTIGWQHSSYDAYFRNRNNKTGYWNEDFLFEKYFPKLNCIVVLNENDKAIYLKEKNIASEAISNPKPFCSETKALLSEHRFIAVGALRYAKGFDLLINSFEKFHAVNPEWILDIFGEGAERTNLEALINQNDLQEFIHLRGWTNGIKDEMLKSSGLLLSSRWEGMPMVALEAIELGVPVIAYDIPAIGPIVSDGIEGMVVESFNYSKYASAMCELASNDNLRKDMGRAAANKAKQFDIKEIAKQWENLYKNLIQK